MKSKLMLIAFLFAGLSAFAADNPFIYAISDQNAYKLSVNGSTVNWLNAGSYYWYSRQTMDSPSFSIAGRDGYSVAWYTGSSMSPSTCGTKLCDGEAINYATIKKASSVTIQDNQGYLICPKYAIVKFDLSFEPDGGSGSISPKSSLDINSSFTLPSSGFTRPGYTLSGWKCKVCGKTFSLGQSVSGSDFWDSSSKSFHTTLLAKWTPNTYTIAIDPNGGTGGSVSPGSYQTSESSQSATVTPPTWAGHTLTSWTISGATGGSPYVSGNSLIVPAGAYGNLTVKANWTAIDYKINVDNNGGEGGKVNLATYNSSSSKQTRDITKPTWRGRKFTSWSVECEGGTPTVSGSTLNIPANCTKDITLTAGWYTNTYSITIDANGGTGGSVSTNSYQINEIEDLAVTVTQPTNTGYAFTSWTITGADGSTPSIEDGVLTIPANTIGNLELKANWEAINYVIVVDPGEGSGGSVNPSSYNIKKSSQSFTITPPTWDGHKLEGWAISGASNGVPTIVGTTLTIPKNCYGDITLNALWKTNTYSISINPNGGEGGIVSPNSYMTSSKSQSATITPPAWDGHSLTSWTIIGASGGTPSVSGNTLTIPADTYGDIELKAEWKINTFAIGYELDGGIGGAKSPTAGEYDKVLYVSDPTKTGYDFMGWVLVGEDADYEHAKWGVGEDGVINPIDSEETVFPVTINGGVYVKNLSIKAKGKVALRAKWELSGYTLTINPNGGKFRGSTTPTQLSESLVYGSDVLNYVEPSVDEVEHKVFQGYEDENHALVYDSQGYNKKCDYWTDAYPDGTFKGNKNLTLKAKWGDPIPWYTVEVEASPEGSGSVTGGGEYESGSMIELSATANTGYSFCRWCKGSEIVTNSPTYSFNVVSNTAGTYTADFTGNVYKVTYYGMGGNPSKTEAFETYGSTYSHQPTLQWADEGYAEFQAWYTEPEGEGDRIDGNSIVTNASNHKLYAHWKEVEYPAKALDLDPKVIEFTLKGTAWAKATDESAKNGDCLRLNSNDHDSEVWGSLKENGILYFSYKGGNTEKISWKLQKNEIIIGGGNVCTAANAWCEGVITNRYGECNVIFYHETGGVFQQPSLDNVRWTPGSEIKCNVTIDGDEHVTARRYSVDGSAEKDVPDGGVVEVPFGSTLRAYAVAATGYTVTPESIEMEVWEDQTLTFATMPITYSIQFDGNGATSGETAAMVCTYDVATSLTANGFTKTDCRFIGWKDLASGNEYDNCESVKNLATEQGTTVTMTAQWQKLKNYTITYHPKGGMPNEDIVTNKLEGATNKLDAVYAKIGYSQDGWSTSQDGGKVYELNDEYSIDSDLELWAVWTPNHYAIEFNGNGAINKMEPMDCTFDQVTNLTACTLEYPHYNFLNWTNAAGRVFTNCAEVLNLATNNGDEVELFAQWAVCTYKVTLDFDGGFGGTESVNVSWDQSLPDVTPPTLDGCRFAGYFTEKGGEGTQYYDATGKSDKAYDFAKEPTLYAAWKVDVVFVDESGAFEAVTNTVKRGASVTNTPAWLLSECETIWTPPSPYNDLLKSIEVKATFKSLWRTLTLKAGEHVAKVEYSTNGVDYVTAEDLPCDVSVLKGSNWWARAEADAGYHMVETNKTGTMDVDCDVSFEAAENEKYYINYYPGSGISGQKYAQTNLLGIGTELLCETYFSTGRGQSGWAETDGGDKEYDFGAVCSNSLSLYPSWTNNHYTVTLNYDGGSGGPETILVEYGKTYSALEGIKPVKDGYAFVDWYLGGQKIEEDTKVTTARDHTLIAKWQEDVGDVSRALDCNNLKFTAENWEPNTDLDWCTNTISSMKLSIYDGNSIKATIKQSGNLIFWYKFIGDAQQPKITVEAGAPAEFDCSYDEWLCATCRVEVAVADESVDVIFTYSGLEGDECAIDKVTWIPDGGDEPKPGDEPKISTAEVKDGKFQLTFQSDARFDYELQTNANLQVQSWGVKETWQGTGEEHTFSPDIDKTKPCLFYRVETIQKRRK